MAFAAGLTDVPHHDEPAAIVQILRKFAAHSSRIWTKNERNRERRFQASLLSVARMRRTPTAAKQDKGRVMRFLIKTAFWLTVVALLLPGDDKHPAAPAPDIGAAEAVSAASAAVSDMRQFCARQPEACTVGSHAAVALGQKAQTGAKLLYEFLNERMGPNETGSVAARAAGQPAAAGAVVPSQNTLTPSDLAPVWRGPEPRRDPRRPA